VTLVHQRQVISFDNIKNVAKNPQHELAEFAIETNCRTFVLRGESPAIVVRASPVESKLHQAADDTTPCECANVRWCLLYRITTDGACQTIVGSAYVCVCFGSQEMVPG
jgi:hypothetical protein